MLVYKLSKEEINLTLWITQMLRIEPTKLFILERRNAIIHELHKEGYSGGEISQMMNGLDRTWIFRIIQAFSKHKKTQK